MSQQERPTGIPYVAAVPGLAALGIAVLYSTGALLKTSQLQDAHQSVRDTLPLVPLQQLLAIGIGTLTTSLRTLLTWGVLTLVFLWLVHRHERKMLRDEPGLVQDDQANNEQQATDETPEAKRDEPEVSDDGADADKEDKPQESDEDAKEGEQSNSRSRSPKLDEVGREFSTTIVGAGFALNLLFQPFFLGLAAGLPFLGSYIAYLVARTNPRRGLTVVVGTYLAIVMCNLGNAFVAPTPLARVEADNVDGTPLRGKLIAHDASTWFVATGKNQFEAVRAEDLSSIALHSQKPPHQRTSAEVIFKALHVN